MGNHEITLTECAEVLQVVNEELHQHQLVQAQLEVLQSKFPVFGFEDCLQLAEGVEDGAERNLELVAHCVRVTGSLPQSTLSFFHFLLAEATNNLARLVFDVQESGFLPSIKLPPALDLKELAAQTRHFRVSLLSLDLDCLLQR